MTQSRNKILVTGGAGYIGSVLIGQLLNNGVDVRTIDNLSFGGVALLPYLSYPNFEFIRGDIRNSQDRIAALNDVKAVVHLAAIVGDPQCADMPETATAINKDASEQLCLEAKAANVRRFVFASTCSNYGKMADPNGFVDETSPLAPVSLYAELKVGFERFLSEENNSGFETVCLRFATAYGLSPRPRLDLTVNEFAVQLAMGKTLEVYGEQFWRPYCHTTDIARAIRLALDAPSEVVSGQPFNVGNTDENYQKKTLVAMILDRLGCNKEQRDELIKWVQRDEDPRDYRVCFDKIEKQLNFQITRTVADGIDEYVTAVQSGLLTNCDNSYYRNV